MNLTAPLSLASGTYNVNDPNALATFGGVISGAGALNITGNPTLSGVNTYTRRDDPQRRERDDHQQPGLRHGNDHLSITAADSTPPPPAGQLPSPTLGDRRQPTANFNGTNAIQLSGSTTLPAGNESIQITNAGLSVTLSGPISAGPAAAAVGQSSSHRHAGHRQSGQHLQRRLHAAAGRRGRRPRRQHPARRGDGHQHHQRPLGDRTVTLGTGGAAVTLANNGGSPVTLGNTVDLASGTFTSLAGLTLSGKSTSAEL